VRRLGVVRVVGVVLLAACSSDGDEEVTPTTPAPALTTTTVRLLGLPTHTFDDGGVADGVEGPVRIAVVDGVVCVTLDDKWREEEVLIIWPPGFTATELDGSPVVLTANGAPIELVDGESRSIGGGVIPADVSHEAAACPDLTRFVVHSDLSE